MKNKFLFIIAVLVLGTVLAACGPSTITVQPQPMQRTLTVTGSGMVTLTPDVAYIYISVHTENVSVAEAVAENNTKAQAVATAIKGFGVEAKDIQTTNFSIWPQDQYDDKGNKTGTIYNVDNTVYITVRDLTKIGDLLDASIRAGANTINSIQFDVADKTEALSQARKAAVENAQKQAQELVDATGVKLGDVQTISYYDSTPLSADYGKGGGAMAASSVPVSSGQYQLTTTVTIVYELK
ncbi:MAG: SIMPL domain-containing protein [Anaerolineales bacterium]|nr:SIMPL domain-containing protein [Anaerolineales bacterium]